MNIFGGRPGFAAGITAIVAILAVIFLPPAVAVALLVIAVLSLPLLITLCTGGYITPYRLFATVILLLVFIAALLRGMAVFGGSSGELLKFAGEERTIQGVVTERRTSSERYTVYKIELKSIDGEKCDASAILNCENASQLQAGHEFIIRNAEIYYVPDLPEKEAASLISENIFLSADNAEIEDCIIISEHDPVDLDLFRSLNSYLSAKLRLRIGGDEGRLAAAMLLGDRSSLTAEMSRDFNRAGLSHYLAVSGLHVSIITGIVGFILMQLRIRKAYRNLLLALFALFYLLLLGFPVSATRSVVMLLIVFLSYSMGDDSDPANSLGIAAAIIILISPASVFDASFILSFTATLGIVCFMPVFNSVLEKLFDKKDGKRSKTATVLKKLLGMVFGVLVTTASALSLTLLPVTFLFGEISVLGFRSNLAAAIAGAPLLGSSLFYLLLGDIPYLGEGLAFVIRACARYFLELSASLSDTPGALISLISVFSGAIVVCFSILIYFFLVVKVKYKKPLLLLPALYPVILAVLVLFADLALPAKPKITFLGTGRDETAFFACGEGAVLIDISDGSYSRLRTLSDEAHSAGYTEFDTLILTHYHRRHLSSVSRFTADQKVRRVLLPYPENEDDAWIMLQLSEMLAWRGIPCDLIKADKPLSIGGGVFLEMTEISRLKRSNHPMIAFSVSSDERKITYIGESAWEAEYIRNFVKGANTLVLGSHGPIAKSDFPPELRGDIEYVFFNGSPIEFFRGLRAEKIRVNVGKTEYTLEE